MPPAALALLIQLAAAGLMLGLSAIHPVPAWGFALGVGAVACGLSMILRQPRWWWGLHVIFLPAVMLMQKASIAPGWFLAGFLLLALCYWNSARGQVPLYLSNTPTARAVAALLPSDARATVIDAGCGTGSLISRLGRERPDCQVIGLENAPLPWVIARIRALTTPNCQVRFGNLWAARFAKADVVYAFLSPVPMARLWEKCRAEMKPGALLVSNSFAVPEVPPDEVIRVSDKRGTQLFCYRIRAPGQSGR
ncbi:MAG: hypothetical protein RIR70_178 [Pseudomonadota bacterium]